MTFAGGGLLSRARLLLADDNAAFDKATAQAEAALSPTGTLQRRKLANVLLSTSDSTGPATTRKSEDVEKDTVVDSPQITAENAQEYIDRLSGA